jgi:hypothetical protein
MVSPFPLTGQSTAGVVALLALGGMTRAAVAALGVAPGEVALYLDGDGIAVYSNSTGYCWCLILAAAPQKIPTPV